MKKLILVFCLCLGGCVAGTNHTTETNNSPVLTSYHGIADVNGDFCVRVGHEPPIVQVWCTDLAGVRASVSFRIDEDDGGAIWGKCEPGGEFEISIID